MRNAWQGGGSPSGNRFEAPYDRGVSPVVAAILGALAGLLVGAAVMVAVVRGRAAPVEALKPVENDEVSRVISALRSGVAVVGEHDELLAHNAPAETLGLVRGTRIAVPAVLELVRTCRRDEEDGAANLEQARAAGRPAVQLAVRVLPLDAGRVFVVADDRAEALRVHESSRDFMTNATHELKTPIGAISLLAEALSDSPDDPDAVTRFAGKIQQESGRLGALVQQIITLSRLQHRPALGNAHEVPVDMVVADALQRCQHLASGRSVSLTASGAGGLWVRGDAAQLTTACENLIQNAINYSDPKARVVVTKRAAEDTGGRWVEIAVSDNGIGIAPAEQERIFERFYRVDYARSRETGGTGLGLSIVSEIAEGHGGSVEVWSQPGSGSTFTLRLPAVAPDDPEGES